MATNRPRPAVSLLRRFQPQVAGLEPRAVPSASPPGSLLVAALGDSLTDEYTFYGPEASAVSLPFPLPADFHTVGRNSARNWPLILSALRPNSISFGPYTTADRGPTRGAGFEENWAASGATAGGTTSGGTSNTLAEQVTGLLTQNPTTGVAPDRVNTVVILVGANDYLHGLIDFADSLGRTNAFVPTKGSKLSLVNATVEGAIRAAVDQIRATTPATRIVLVTTPDITVTPLVRSALKYAQGLFPDLETQMKRSAAVLGRDLAALASARGLTLVNFADIYQRVRTNPTIGGLRVDLNTSGPDLTDGFVGDGFHPGTLLQGRVAQAIARAIDATDPARQARPITDRAIVAYARGTTPAVAAVATPGPTPGTVTLVATVAPGLGAPVVPTGSVTFEEINPATSASPASFGPVLGTVPLTSAGRAALTVPAAALATGTTVAVYNGDRADTVQRSGPLGPPSNPSETGSASPSFVSLTPTYTQTGRGASVDLQVVITSDPAHTDDLAGGTVRLVVGQRTFLTLPVSRNVARATVPLARLRGRTVEASYGGDGEFAPANSAPVRIEPNSPAR